MQAIDVMTAPVVTVTPEMNVSEVAKLLLRNRISAVPVVDQNHSIVGMLSEGDLMRRSETGTSENHSWWLSLVADLRAEAFVKSHGVHVKDVMTRKVISVLEDTPLEEVATLLERHRIKRVPVLRDGRIVGIVSRANLLHGLIAFRTGVSPSRNDQQIRTAILDELKRIDLPRRFLNVVVSNKIVYLWGAVNSESESDAYRIAAENSPGVQRVENNIFILPAKIRGALGGE